MTKPPSIQFYPGDWLRDEVSGCSLAAQGLWLRMMFIAHGAERHGYLGKNGVPIPPTIIAQMCGTQLEQYTTLLAELDRAGVPSRSENGTLYSRRMVRDAKLRMESKKYGEKGGNPALVHHWDNGGVNHPHNPSLKRKKKLKREIFGKEGPGENPPPGKPPDPSPIEFFALIPEPLRVPKFLDAWRAWLQSRRDRRKPYTETAASRALPKLAEEGVDQAVLRIDRSITNDWQGLFFANESTAQSVQRQPPPARKSRADENMAAIDAALDEVEAESRG